MLALFCNFGISTLLSLALHSGDTYVKYGLLSKHLTCFKESNSMVVERISK